MNGRIYDAKLGRFLQADPIVQAPKNSQSLNRYSYVLNNPLSYTDPTGYFSLKRLINKLRPLISIALTVWAPWGTGLWASVGTGALAGWIAAGNLKGALVGAFTAGVANKGGFWAKSVAGGVSSRIQGGDFKSGFLSAGFTEAFSGSIAKIKGKYARFKQAVAAAIVGGTASEISGGKFKNGATTAAIQYAFSAVAAGDGPRDLTDIKASDMTDEEFAAVFGTPDEWYALQFTLPVIDLPQWFVDGAAGLGDSLSFGLTRYARSQLNIYGGINTDSASYNVGSYSALAAGGARLIYSGGALVVRGIGSRIGGLQGAQFASSARNTLKIAARGGLFPNFQIYPFSTISARYGGNAANIIQASGRTNAAINTVGISAGGGSAVNRVSLCASGVSGC